MRCERNSNAHKQPQEPSDLDRIFFPFGKYKDHSVSEVAASDKAYLCHVAGRSACDSLQQRVCKSYPELYEAVRSYCKGHHIDTRRLRKRCSYLEKRTWL